MLDGSNRPKACDVVGDSPERQTGKWSHGSIPVRPIKFSDGCLIGMSRDEV